MKISSPRLLALCLLALTTAGSKTVAECRRVTVMNGGPAKVTCAYCPAENWNGPPASIASRTRRMSCVIASIAVTRQPSRRWGWTCTSSASIGLTVQSDHGTERQGR